MPHLFFSIRLHRPQPGSRNRLTEVQTAIQLLVNKIEDAEDRFNRPRSSQGMTGIGFGGGKSRRHAEQPDHRRTFCRIIVFRSRTMRIDEIDLTRFQPGAFERALHRNVRSVAFGR